MGTQNKKTLGVLGVGRIVLGKVLWMRNEIQILSVGALRFFFAQSRMTNRLTITNTFWISCLEE